MSDLQADTTKSILRFLRILIGIGVLAVVLCYVDLRQFFDSLLSVEPLIFAATVALSLLARFIRAWKWNSLLAVRGIQISTWQAIRLSLVSHFTGAWTPGQIGGDAYRVLALRSYGKSDVVFSTVLIERYAGLCAVSFFSLLTLPITIPHLYNKSPWVLAIVCAAIFLVAGVIPCLFSRRISIFVVNLVPGFRRSSLGGKIRQFYLTIAEFREFKSTMAVYALVTLLETLFYFFVNYLAARSLGLDVSLTYFLLAMPIVHLLLRIPISFQGLGIQEGCFVYALIAHGFTPAEGLAVSVLQRTLEWILAIVPGAILLWLTSGPPPGDDDMIHATSRDDQSTANRAIPIET